MYILCNKLHIYDIIIFLLNTKFKSVHFFKVTVMILLPVKDDECQFIAGLLQRHNMVKDAGTLLQVDFTTLSDYLHLLQVAAQALASCGKIALLYLAAAVSDFYIPSSHMVRNYGSFSHIYIYIYIYIYIINILCFKIFVQYHFKRTCRNHVINVEQ